MLNSVKSLGLLLLPALVSSTVGSGWLDDLDGQRWLDKEVQSATQVYASLLNTSSLFSQLAADHHLHKVVPADEQSYFQTTLAAGLTASFKDRLCQELSSPEDWDPSQGAQELWAAVQRGMRADLSQFLSQEFFNKNSESSLSLLKRDVFSKEFKSGLKRDWHRLGLNLDRIAHIFFYNCIYRPFVTLRGYFRVWMFKLRRRWANFQFKRAANRMQKELKRGPKKSFGAQFYEDFPVMREFAQKHL